MAKSLLDRLSAEDYALIKERVYYDPSSPTGLRWRDIARPIRGRQAPKDGVAGSGKTLFVESNTYPCAAVVMLLNDIWPEDDQNVVTRKDSSGPWSDAANLQWAKHGDSRRRNAELARVALVRSVLGDDGPDLGDRLRLNAPCPKGHLWNGHQLGLQRRWGQSWRCDECSKDRSSEDQEKRKERNKKRYQENIEEERRKARERMRNTIQAKLDAMTPEEQNEYRKSQSQKTQEYFRSNGRKSRSKALTGFVIPPHLIGGNLIAEDIKPFASAGVELLTLSTETVKESRKLWFHLKNTTPAPTVAELVEKESQRKISMERIEFLENGGTEEEWKKEYGRRQHHIRMANDPDYVAYMRQKSKRRKAQMRDSVAIQVKGREIRARFAEFGHRCAYCGADGDLHIEHVVPISKGGPHSIGNIIPACESCNYSKRDHDVETWYRSEPFFSELRWRKICRVLGWQRSSVGQLALL
jgi:5-methylcytosine-specific restriction endonuclease McrA